ncbi:hypothetical protein R5R35_010081 [Gryllus longicercus]|uniref:Desaturase n=1 Tax=Gryllus longicercus TaxID=2509291 RepID=A0AAN9VNM7_9ORTH
MFQKRWFFPLYLLLGLVIPVSIPVFLWSEDLANSFLICYAFRTVNVWHATWFVNSLAHWEGSRPFDKTLKPVDSAFVAKVTIGEGWHNFHHRFPFDYTTSLEHKSYHWSTSIINWASRHGWVWDLRRVTPSAVRQAILISGDGSVTPDEVIG